MPPGDSPAGAESGRDRGRAAHDRSGGSGDQDHLGDLGGFIRAQREIARMSVRRLADLAGVSNPYLSQIERGIRKPSADILQQLAEALRISVESLYVRAGFLPHHEGRTSTVPEAIEHDQVLTAEQKLALLNVYRSFVEHAGERPAERHRDAE